MVDNYMKDQNVNECYDMWINSPTLLDHGLDRERFYRFVKACVKYAGYQNIRKKIDTSILRTSLYNDLHEKCSQEGYDDITSEIVELFESLLEYEETT